MNKLIFILLFALPALHICNAQNAQKTSSSGFEFSDLFESTPTFERGAVVANISIGLKSDTKITEFENKIILPALSLTIDKVIAKNIGFGVMAGVQMWEVPSYKYRYHQYNLGVRGSYHINILEQLDPYIALGGTLRYMDVFAGDYYKYKMKVTPAFLVGGRYYFAEKIALAGEIGDDTLTWFRLGLSFKLK